MIQVELLDDSKDVRNTDAFFESESGIKIDRFNIYPEQNGELFIEEDPEDRYGSLAYVFVCILATVLFFVIGILLLYNGWLYVPILFLLASVGIAFLGVYQWKYSKSTRNKTYRFTADGCEIRDEVGRSTVYFKERVISLFTRKTIHTEGKEIKFTTFGIILKVKRKLFGTKKIVLLFFDVQYPDGHFKDVDSSPQHEIEGDCLLLAAIIARHWKIPNKC